MPITKEAKTAIYQRYLNALSKTQGMVIAEYRGMSMKNLNAIRAALRQVDSHLVVVKSTIFRIALRDTGFAAPKDLTVGPIAVALAYSDIAKVTKTLMAQLKDQPLLVLKGAIMGPTIFREHQLEALATMPTMEEARAMLIGTLQSPATQLMGLLSQPGQNLAAILKAYTDKQQGGEAA